MIITSNKQSTSFHWNSYGMMEYMLVLHPGQKIFEKVLNENQEYFEQFGEKTAIKTEPHINIANFLAKEAMGDGLLTHLID